MTTTFAGRTTTLIVWGAIVIVVAFVVAGAVLGAAEQLITATERENLRQLQVLNGRLAVQYMQTKQSLEFNAAQINTTMDKFRARCVAAKQEFNNELIVCEAPKPSKPTAPPAKESK